MHEKRNRKPDAGLCLFPQHAACAASCNAWMYACVAPVLVGIKAAAGAYIHALQLERANSLLASIDGNFHAGVPDLGAGSRCACSTRSTDAAAAREGPP